MRFMPDWAGDRNLPEDYYGYINWHQTQKGSKDVNQNKRYAIVLPNTDEMIGMVGMGLEYTINEVEVAYFMSEKYQMNGYTKEAINALVDWCFSVSDLKYLILTIDCANIPSCNLAEECGFELFEKRTSIGHKQPNMESDCYFCFRRYRNIS